MLPLVVTLQSQGIFSSNNIFTVMYQTVMKIINTNQLTLLTLSYEYDIERDRESREILKEREQRILSHTEPNKKMNQLVFATMQITHYIAASYV